MRILEKLIHREMKKQGYVPGEAMGVTKAEILSEMEPDMVQLIAALPKDTMDSVWKALGVDE